MNPFERVGDPEPNAPRRRMQDKLEDARMAANRINGSRFEDVLGGTSAEDLLNGRGGDDLLRGRDGDDDLRGGFGNDRLFGGDGDDRLDGGAGDDEIFGGAGDDLLIWNNGDGSDVMRGGAGDDAARVLAKGRTADELEIASDGGAISLARTNDRGFSLDLRGIETIRVDAGGGGDAVDATGLVAGLARLIVEAGAGADEVLGSQGADVIRGGAGADLLVGFLGDDRMFGGGGGDLFVWNNGDGSDLMDGGDGADVVAVNGAEAAGNVFSIVVAESGVRFARSNLGLFELDLRDVETLRVNGGAEADDVDAAGLAADAISLELFGNGGEDRLAGGDGGDLLVGGTGNDVVDGGGGDDLLVWNNGDGSDRMIGGDGVDALEVNGAEGEIGDAFVVANQAANDAFLFSRVNLGLFELDASGVERLVVRGGSGDDALDTTALSNSRASVTFVGGEGADSFVGGGASDDTSIWNEGDGNDVFNGGRGIGVDVMVINAFNEDEDQTIVLESGQGGGVRTSRSGDFRIEAIRAERLEVNTGAGDDAFNAGRLGNGKVGLLVVDAGAGDDALQGGAGRDELIGGAGDDTYLGRGRADVFVFGRGRDTILDFEDGIDALKAEGVAGFEDLTITQDGDDALITLADGASVRLEGFSADDVTAADFVF